MNYFKNIELFSDLSVEDQENFSMFCQQQSLVAGETLFSQGDTPQAMYIISSGVLLINKDIRGEDITVATLESGDIVGEMAFYGEPPVRTATVKASVDTIVLVIIDFSIQQMFAKYPDLHAKIQKIIQERSI